MWSPPWLLGPFRASWPQARSTGQVSCVAPFLACPPHLLGQRCAGVSSGRWGTPSPCSLSCAQGLLLHLGLSNPCLWGLPCTRGVWPALGGLQAPSGAASPTCGQPAASTQGPFSPEVTLDAIQSGHLGLTFPGWKSRDFPFTTLWGHFIIQQSFSISREKRGPC